MKSMYLFTVRILIFMVIGCQTHTLNTIDEDRPSKNLCVNTDANCSNQIESSTQNRCFLKYFNRTSSDCSDSEFKGVPGQNEQYGSVKLIPAEWFDSGFRHPTINVTLTDIQWKYLRMRFVKVGTNEVRLCREFVLPNKVEPSSVISFDCLFGENGGQDFKFQFILTTNNNDRLLYNYLFQFPKESDVNTDLSPENYRLFMIVDESEFPSVHIKLMVPPSKLKIKNIYVKLFYLQNLESDNDVLLELWPVDMKGKHEGNFVKVGPFNLRNYDNGYFYFNASYNSEICKNNCLETSSSLQQIKGWRLGTGFICAITIITLSIFGVFGTLSWKKRSKKLANFTDAPEKLPEVLFIYNSDYPSHVDEIYVFSKFLELHCPVIPKVDLVEIPKSDSKDSLRWYCSAFKTADYVLLFASPDKAVAKKGIHPDNIYQGLSTCALNLLKNYLIEKNQMGQVKFPIAIVKLPGCSCLPLEEKFISKRFSLPEKLEDFFEFIKLPKKFLPNGGEVLLEALSQKKKTHFEKPIIALSSCASDNDSLEQEMLEPPTIGDAKLNWDGHSSSDETEEENIQLFIGLNV